MKRQITVFVLGVIAGVVVLVGGAYLYARLGLVDPRADIPVPATEKKVAMKFLDASLERREPETKNPVSADEPNLKDGMQLYQANCAGCHGDINHIESASAKTFYPRAPQLMHEKPDMPESQNYYLIKHGIRYSAMPAWRDLMTDQQIRQVVTFLSRMNNLSPQMQQQWKELAK